MKRPAVSILTPTFKREKQLKLQLNNVWNQSYQDFEWLILDDSQQPSKYFRGLTDPRIRYTHLTERLSVGAKRNWLAENAASEILVQFDDDDFYAPTYVERMVARLSAGFDAAKLSGFFVYTQFWEKFGYWNLEAAGGLHWHFDASGVRPLFVDDAMAAKLLAVQRGFGFSYAYRKDVWRTSPFESVNFGEDGGFYDMAQTNGFQVDLFLDGEGLCLHILRQDNASACYPQYMLPDFMVEKIFGPKSIAMTGRSNA
jgi:glycosyltransferase involved in cell wall biosynthesis